MAGPRLARAAQQVRQPDFPGLLVQVYPSRRMKLPHTPNTTRHLGRGEIAHFRAHPGANSRRVSSCRGLRGFVSSPRASSRGHYVRPSDRLVIRAGPPSSASASSRTAKASQDEETQAVGQWLREHLDAGLQPQECAVFVRFEDQLPRAQQALQPPGASRGCWTTRWRLRAVRCPFARCSWPRGWSSERSASGTGPGKAQLGAHSDQPLPPYLGGNYSSDEDKIERLALHVRWAARAPPAETSVAVPPMVVRGPVAPPASVVAMVLDECPLRDRGRNRNPTTTSSIGIA